MTLIATPAAANANSYLTVAGADALAGVTLGAEATGWLDAEDVDAKEKALITATRDVNAYLRSGFDRHTATQALRFPRSTDLDSDGEPVIPVDIEYATFYQAIFLLRNHGVLAQANTRRARGMQSASEPNLSYSEDAERTIAERMSPQAVLHLEGFATIPGGGSAGGLRSVRVSSGFVGF